jgi:hypothetical protein
MFLECLNCEQAEAPLLDWVPRWKEKMVVVLQRGFVLVEDSLCSWPEAVSHLPLLVKTYRRPSYSKGLRNLVEEGVVGTESAAFGRLIN